jgi:hypothetical protein
VALVAGAVRAASAEPLAGPSLGRTLSPVPAPFAEAPPHLALPPSTWLAGAVPPGQQTKKWYGYQIMAADLTAIGLALFGSQTLVAGMGLLAAPPAIHGVHGRTDLAIASPLLRASLTAAGVLVGASASACSHAPEESRCGFEGAAAGAAIGLLAAMVVDWSLAWQSVPGPASLGREAAPHGTGLEVTAATVAPTANGASLLVGGRF